MKNIFSLPDCEILFCSREVQISLAIFGTFRTSKGSRLVLIFQTFFLSYNHCNLGGRNHCSGNQTCSAAKETVLLSLVAPRCGTHDRVLHHCCCSMDRGLRIHCLGFRLMDRGCSPANGLYFTRPIPPPAVVEQFLLLRSGSNVL